jgi:hypothetical protein
MPRYKCITSVQIDVPDNDNVDLGTSVDYEWFEEEPTKDDFPRWDLVDHDHDCLIVGRFDHDYIDGEWSSIYVTTYVDLHPEPEEE